jgi:RNA polymerase sigma-70 factor, ECF subfamily
MIARKPGAKGEYDYASDLALAQAAGSGDDTARRVLCTRLFDHVRAAVFYIASGHRDVEDCVQLALIEILKSVGSFQGRSSLEAWAERIAVRTALRHIKRQKWRSGIVGLDPECDQMDSISMEAELIRKQVSRRLVQILGLMQPKQKYALILRLVLGYSVEEISDVTGTNAHTVRYRLQRGRKILRHLLREDDELLEWMRNEDR